MLANFMPYVLGDFDSWYPQFFGDWHDDADAGSQPPVQTVCPRASMVE